MPASLRVFKLRIAIWFALAALLICGSAVAETPDLEVFVGDTTAMSGEQNTAISLFMRNYDDSIAGFNIWIQLNRPDIMEFNIDLDTIEYEEYYRYTEFDPDPPNDPTDSIVASLWWVCTEWEGEDCVDSIQDLGYYRCLQYDEEEPPKCIDSVFIPGYDTFYIDTTEAYVGNIDTVGTLIRSWERIETRSLGGYGQDMLITAFADQMAPPPDTTTPGIGVQYGEYPLIRIQGDVFDIPSSDTDRTVEIRIEANIIDYFSFADPEGNSIGIITEEVEDTLFWICDDWVPPESVICAYYVRVPEEPPEGADSIAVYTYLHGYLDTAKVKIYNGSLIVLDGLCGDVTGDGAINILDIVKLINYKYKSGAEPENLGMCDVNCDQSINILDIVRLINFKYKSGTPPFCCPEFWQ